MNLKGQRLEARVAVQKFPVVQVRERAHVCECHAFDLRQML